MTQKHNRPVLTPKAADVATRLAKTNGMSISAAVSKVLERLDRDLPPPGAEHASEVIQTLQRNGHKAQARLIGNAWHLVQGTLRDDADPELVDTIEDLAALLFMKGGAN